MKWVSQSCHHLTARIRRSVKFAAASRSRCGQESKVFSKLTQPKLLMTELRTVNLRAMAIGKKIYHLQSVGDLLLMTIEFGSL